MNILELPDDILIQIFKKNLSFSDLFSLSKCCTRFLNILNKYNIWLVYLNKLPLLDYSYPYGYSDYFCYSDNYFNKYTCQNLSASYMKWIENKYSIKLFYSYGQKMLPHIQLDDDTNNTLNHPSMYLSDANKLIWINTNDIEKYEPTPFQLEQLNSKYLPNQAKNRKSINNIAMIKSFNVFEDQDIKGFKKKDNIMVCFSKDDISVNELCLDTKQLYNIKYLVDDRVNCVDFSILANKLIYGCSNGYLKVLDLHYEDENSNELIAMENLGDRILRSVISPCGSFLAIGLAGIRAHPNNNSVCPLRIYDFENFKEVATLQPAMNKDYKRGAGILGLSYLDENTLVTSGYDTFIRFYDMRNNRCVQSFEEPEDMSVYAICASKSNGMISGNDRFSLIRYWDRRKNRIIKTYNASKFDSSIYSLASSPNSIYAAWERGLTIINF